LLLEKFVRISLLFSITNLREEEILVRKNYFFKWTFLIVFLIVFLNFSFVFLSVNTTIASQLSDDSLIYTYLMENPTGVLLNETTTNTVVEHEATSELGSSIRARGDLSTGSTGATFIQGSIDSQNGQSLVTLYDTLTFFTPYSLETSVTMSLDFDGILANTSTDGYAKASTSVTIYDITGYDNWLYDYDSSEDIRPGPLSSINKVYEISIDFALGAERYITALSQFPLDQTLIDTTGTYYSFDLSKSGTFEVDPFKTYGIKIRTSSNAAGLYKGLSSAEFYNTSVFEFTNLNGATFQSGSGVFIGSQNSNSTIPEPTTMLLFGVGLIGLAGVSRKK